MKLRIVAVAMMAAALLGASTGQVHAGPVEDLCPILYPWCG